MIAGHHKDHGEASHSAGGNDSVDQPALPVSTLSTSLANLIGLAPRPALGRSATHHTFKLGRFEITLRSDEHPVIVFAHPVRKPVADHHEADMAVATSKRLLDRLATGRSPIIGYHLRFPGLGQVERTVTASTFIPGV